MAATNKCLAQSNKSRMRSKATKKRNSAIGLIRWVQIIALCLRSSRHLPLFLWSAARDGPRLTSRISFCADFLLRRSRCLTATCYLVLQLSHVHVYLTSGGSVPACALAPEYVNV